MAFVTEFPAAGLRRNLRRNWGWLLTLGIVLILLGTAGLYMLVALTIVSALWFGALLLAGGIFQGIDAFRERDWGGFALHVLIALVYIVTGAFVIYDPVAASLTLTLFIAASLLVAGVLRIVMAFRIRPAGGWWLALVAGLVSIGLGIMIFAGWPASGLFVIGLFVAIELLMQGFACITLALAARTMKPDDRAAIT
jgi:uncharacterized membrane protein HdeD (DUF308 family)